MKDIWGILIGVVIVIVLSAGVGYVYYGDPKPVSKSIRTENKVTGLNQDFSRTDLYTEITVNDILEGRVLEAEMAEAKPFLANTINHPRYKETNYGMGVRLVMDDGDWQKIKSSFTLSPFRNLFYYKINFEDNYAMVLGQQVKNKNGSYAFLHYLLSYGKYYDSRDTNIFAVEPLVAAASSDLDYYIPRELISSDPKYYESGNEMEKLIRQWQKSGNVPHELENKILLMNRKW